MNSDATFRYILVAGFVIVFLVTLHHRIKSWASAEKLDRRQEGLFILVAVRLAGLAFWLGVIAYMIQPASMGWSAAPVPDGWRWAGVAVFVVAVALLAWTLVHLGTNLTDTVVTRRAHTLVTRGPYRWVRHPFYVSMALLIVATSLVAANAFLLASGGAVLVLLAVRTRTEEEKLLARFGDDYRAYMLRTGRFIPRLR